MSRHVLLRVLTQAEEREDGQNHDDQADKINQSIHAPLLVQWRSEHKTAHKEESSGTAETRDRSATKSARSRHRRWRLKGARQQRQIRHVPQSAHGQWVTAPVNEPGADAGPGAGPGLVSTAIPGRPFFGLFR
jgi:hypothetical protein